MGNTANMMTTMQGAPGGAMGFFTGPSAAMVAAAESAKAQIQCAYIMAMQCPRSYFQAEAAVIEACQNPDFAEKVEYKLPVGGTTITGPTIRLAELVRRCWRNIYTTERVMHDDDRQTIIQVTAIDLETNSIETAEVIAPKTVERKRVKAGQEIIGERQNSYGEKVFIVSATDAEADKIRKALCAKALRNAIFRLVPSEIVKKAMDTARETIRRADAQDPKDATRRLIACFDEQGVSIEQVEAYIGHTLDKTTKTDVKKLRDCYRAMQGGAKWEEITEPEITEKAKNDRLNEIADKKTDKPEKTLMERVAELKAEAGITEADLINGAGEQQK